jgi:hypothetical protein
MQIRKKKKNQEWLKKVWEYSLKSQREKEMLLDEEGLSSSLGLS